MKLLNFLLFLLVIFALLDPDLIESDPTRIRIGNNEKRERKTLKGKGKKMRKNYDKAELATIKRYFKTEGSYAPREE